MKTKSLVVSDNGCDPFDVLASSREDAFREVNDGSFLHEGCDGVAERMTTSIFLDLYPESLGKISELT